MGIQENISAIKARIDQARKNAPNRNEEVLLVGVTKEVGPDRIQEALHAGLSDLGENRVQEARKKSQIFAGVRWHMVGHLQRNKAREAIQLFHLIHSVDTFRLAEALEKEASRIGREVSIFLQVKSVRNFITNGTFGISIDKAPSLAERIASLSHLRLLGLMTMAPFSESPENARPYFRRLRELKEALEEEGNPRMEMRYLSMGMSQDFEVAIEEGANLVRIGRAIFGER